MCAKNTISLFIFRFNYIKKRAEIGWCLRLSILFCFCVCRVQDISLLLSLYAYYDRFFLSRIKQSENLFKVVSRFRSYRGQECQNFALEYDIRVWNFIITRTPCNFKYPPSWCSRCVCLKNLLLSLAVLI